MKQAEPDGEESDSGDSSEELVIEVYEPHAHGATATDDIQPRQDNPPMEPEVGIEANLEDVSHEGQRNEEMDVAQEGQPERPVRNRRPPNMMTYDSLGHPSYYAPQVSNVYSAGGACKLSSMLVPMQLQQWTVPQYQFPVVPVNCWIHYPQY